MWRTIAACVNEGACDESIRALAIDSAVPGNFAAGADISEFIMNETITRSAGAKHGQEMVPEKMEQIINTAGRVARQRTTLYKNVPADRSKQSKATMDVSIAHQVAV